MQPAVWVPLEVSEQGRGRMKATLLKRYPGGQGQEVRATTSRGHSSGGGPSPTPPILSASHRLEVQQGTRARGGGGRGSERTVKMNLSRAGVASACDEEKSSRWRLRVKGMGGDGRWYRAQPCRKHRVGRAGWGVRWGVRRPGQGARSTWACLRTGGRPGGWGEE